MFPSASTTRAIRTLGAWAVAAHALGLAGCATQLVCESSDHLVTCCDLCADDPTLDQCRAPCADGRCTCSALDAAVADASTDAGPCGLPCPPDVPFCDSSSGRCVQCTDEDLTHCAPGERCVHGRCAECASHSDCPPESPQCDPDSHTCGPCTDASPCEPRTTRTACDTASGACVQCTEADADECPEGVCKPDLSCSDFGPAQGACQRCDTDRNCVDGQLCVTLTYPVGTGAPYGSFCQWRRDATGPGAPNGQCAETRPQSRPWTRQLSAIRSVDRTTADICTLRTTTCTALLQHASTVPGCMTPGADDMACGEPTIADDGRCRDSPAGVPRCTYPCGGDEDCPSGFSCPPPGRDRFCAL